MYGPQPSHEGPSALHARAGRARPLQMQRKYCPLLFSAGADIFFLARIPCIKNTGGVRHVGKRCAAAGK